MKNTNLHLFHINENLYLLETTTTRIEQKNGQPYGGWFFKDFYASFKREVPEVIINTDEFLTSLEMSNKYVITGNHQKDKIIISLKDAYDERVVNGILNKAVDPYEDEDSIDCGDVKVYSSKGTPKRFKKEVVSNKRVKGSKVKNTYEENRKLILNAFRYASAFPITSFQNMMSKENGFMFDYKFAEANRVRGSRGKLSAYLDDCDDILDKVLIRGSLYYLKTKIYGEFLANKRKNYHLKNLNLKSNEGRYHLEVLIANIFPLKVTVDSFELEVIFERVYGSSLLTLAGCSLMEFLRMAQSPNLIPKGDVYNSKVTIVPSFDEEFKVHGDDELFERILRMEEKILSDHTEEKETKEIVVLPESLNRSIPVKLTDVLHPQNKALKRLFSLSDMNIPRSLQTIENIGDNVYLFDKCNGSTFGLDDAYFFIHLNTMLNDSKFNEN